MTEVTDKIKKIVVRLRDEEKLSWCDIQLLMKNKTKILLTIPCWRYHYQTYKMGLTTKKRPDLEKQSILRIFNER